MHDAVPCEIRDGRRRATHLPQAPHNRVLTSRHGNGLNRFLANSMDIDSLQTCLERAHDVRGAFHCLRMVSDLLRCAGVSTRDAFVCGDASCI